MNRNMLCLRNWKLCEDVRSLLEHVLFYEVRTVVCTQVCRDSEGKKYKKYFRSPKARWKRYC